MTKAVQMMTKYLFITKNFRSDKMIPDCYKCKHRRNSPGSAHSACHHPAYQKFHEDPQLTLIGILASVGRTLPIVVDVEGIKVRGNRHGISNGWFNHPFNFDPIWLEECTGYEEADI